MSGGRKIEISPAAMAQARRAGLIGNLEARLARMARHGAPITHAEGNRRYESFIMRVEQGVLVSITRFNPDTGKVIRNIFDQADSRQDTLSEIERQLAHGRAQKPDDEAPTPRPEKPPRTEAERERQRQKVLRSIRADKPKG
jgi:hypothetical protein